MEAVATLGDSLRCFIIQLPWPLDGKDADKSTSSQQDFLSEMQEAYKVKTLDVSLPNLMLSHS